MKPRVRRGYLGLAACLAPVMSTAACASILGFDGEYVVDDASGAAGSGGATGSGGGAASSGITGGGGGGGKCPAGRGPVMKQVGEYCIDKTEVTRAQYAAFVNAGIVPGDVPELPPGCSGKTGFRPTDGRADNLPVAHVDWCDAFAFCWWASKRLCGRIGGGAVEATADYKDPARSEWHRACTGDADSQYPYPGDMFEPTACNGEAYGAGGPVAVGSALDCAWPAGPFAGIVDLSGNLAEWENSCVDEKFDSDCHRRGGSFESATASALQCDTSDAKPRNASMPDIGIRCCADLD